MRLKESESSTLLGTLRHRIGSENKLRKNESRHPECESYDLRFLVEPHLLSRRAGQTGSL